MLDIQYIRDNAEEVKQNCINRRANVDIDRLLELDEKRRQLQQQTDELRAKRKQGSKGKPTEEDIAALRILGEHIDALEKQYGEVMAEYDALLLSVPNRTHPDSPIGGEDDFAVLETHGQPPQFDFEPKDHEVLLSEAGMLDFDRGAKVTGSKFYFTRGDFVRLNRALIQYGIDTVTMHGYQLLETPDMAKEEILVGAGFNPRGEEDQIYSIANTDFSLIGTAEITTLGFHANEVLDLSEGPIRYAALSHCFRKEGGAYGRTSKGLYRVHQFQKLELFVFCKPEESDMLHEEIKNIEKEICSGLEIPYRIIDIPSGDLGAPAYRKYDFEGYMVMKGEQGGYSEITSASNCLDYQARRLNIKYKTAEGRLEYVHTLNGTAVVLTRFPVTVVENYQQADGTIRVPAVLQPYVGKAVIG